MPFILIRACLWLILSGAIIARAKIAKTVRKKPAAIRGVQLRKHSKAREKRYSFGYAVFLILALMK